MRLNNDDTVQFAFFLLPLVQAANRQGAPTLSHTAKTGEMEKTLV